MGCWSIKKRYHLSNGRILDNKTEVLAWTNESPQEGETWHGWKKGFEVGVWIECSLDFHHADKSSLTEAEVVGIGANGFIDVKFRKYFCARCLTFHEPNHYGVQTLPLLFVKGHVEKPKMEEIQPVVKPIYTRKKAKEPQIDMLLVQNLSQNLSDKKFSSNCSGWYELNSTGTGSNEHTWVQVSTSLNQQPYCQREQWTLKATMRGQYHYFQFVNEDYNDGTSVTMKYEGKCKKIKEKYRRMSPDLVYPSVGHKWREFSAPHHTNGVCVKGVNITKAT